MRLVDVGAGLGSRSFSPYGEVRCLHRSRHPAFEPAHESLRENCESAAPSPDHMLSRNGIRAEAAANRALRRFFVSQRFTQFITARPSSKAQKVIASP